MRSLIVLFSFVGLWMAFLQAVAVAMVAVGLEYGLQGTNHSTSTSHRAWAVAWSAGFPALYFAVLLAVGLWRMSFCAAIFATLLSIAGGVAWIAKGYGGADAPGSVFGFIPVIMLAAPAMAWCLRLWSAREENSLEKMKRNPPRGMV